MNKIVHCSCIQPALSCSASLCGLSSMLYLLSNILWLEPSITNKPPLLQLAALLLQSSMPTRSEDLGEVPLVHPARILFDEMSVC